MTDIKAPYRRSIFPGQVLFAPVCTAKIDKFSLTRSLDEKLVMPSFQPGNLFVFTAVKEKLFVVHTRK